MSSPILFFVVIVVIDLVLKSLKDKKKVEQKTQRDITNTQSQVEKKQSGGALKELRRMMEEEFDKQKSNVENLDTRNIPEEDENIHREENKKGKTRQELIKNQEEKVNKHSELATFNRLEREQTMYKARLSDSQVHLSEKDPRIKTGYADFESRRPVSIEVESKSKTNGLINIKRDILKGIIYSEILSKPKSLEK